VKDGAGQKLTYVYFEEDPVLRFAHEGQGAANRGEYRQAARAIKLNLAFY
jgi:hypothetical protein